MTNGYPENLIPWFVLKSVPGVGNHLFKRLMERFESPENVLKAPVERLLQVDGISHRLARTIQTGTLRDEAKRELEGLAEKKYGVVTLADPQYPRLLREIPDPPPFLYVYGHLVHNSRNIAVVGSRNATPYGLSITEQLCRDLVSFDMVVVSGMARGIDTAAHLGAISGKGSTVAVLGSGLDRIYPAENKRLFHRIAENGAVVSELAPATEPDGYNFPARNRIISGMSLGVVIVEATSRSGSLITARLALEQNREVFAVPGSIHSFKSTGTHTLIKQGAKLVEHARDIMEEFADLSKSCADTDRQPPGLRPVELLPEEVRVIEAIGVYPVHIDDIVRKTAMAPGILAGILLKLELKGAVRRSPGNFFSLSKDLHV